MQNVNRFFVLVAALGLLSLTVGCGPSRPVTVKVTGKVTYRGKPVPKGTVNFSPVRGLDGASIRPATGEIQPDGSFEMRTFRTGDGVQPGEYGIAVFARTSTDPTVKAEFLVPKKYISAQTSGLTITIPNDSTPIVKNLDLTD